jgi:hypothetical protein
MKVPPELEHLVRAEERRDAAAEAQYQRDMAFLREAGLKEPEPELDGIAAFKARMEAQARAEAVAEAREARIVNAHPAPAVADPMRALFRQQQADRRRQRRGVIPRR